MFKAVPPGGTFRFARVFDYDPLAVASVTVGGFTYTTWSGLDERFFLRVSATDFVLPDFSNTSVTFITPFTVTGAISAGHFQAGVPLNSADLIGQGFATATLHRGASGLWVLTNLTYTFSPQTDPVPEPATLLLFGTGVVAVAARTYYRSEGQKRLKLMTEFEHSRKL